MTFPFGVLQSDPVRRVIEEALRRQRGYQLPQVTVTARAPSTFERIGQFMARDEPRRIGAAETAADIFLGQLVAPFSNRAADRATEASLERYAASGGNPGKHANLFGAASALGAVTGNVGVSRAIAAPAATPSKLANVVRGAAAGAAENALAAGTGGVVFGTEEGSRDPLDILKQMAGQAAIGAGFGALGGVARSRGLPDDSPELSGARTTGEAVRGSRVFAQAPEGQAQPAGAIVYHGSPHQLPKILPDDAPSRGPGRAGIIRLPGRTPEPAGTPYKAPVDVADTPSGKGPALANLKKLNLGPEAEAKVRDAYVRLGLDKRRVTWEETKAAADELGLNPRKLLDKQGRLRADEALAVRDVISQNARRMVDLAAEKAKAPIDEDRLLLQANIDMLSEETDSFLKRYSLERTRAGRDLNALKIVARESMEPAVWMTQAQRVKGSLPLTSDEGIRITQLAEANDRDALIRFVASLHQSTGLDKLVTLWKAGLLTNPLTHAVNVTSNVAMAGAETSKEVPAAAIDAVISMVRGTERTKSVSLRGLLTEQVKGLSAGAKAARRVLRYGDSAEQLAKWDFRQTNFGDGPGARVLQAYTDGVFRSLSAEDQIFRGAATGRAMEEYARLEAKRLVREGLAKTVDEALITLRGNLPPELVAKAIADAEVATFQQPNVIASMIAGGRRALREHGPLGEGFRAGTEVVMPFVRTPTNIANTLVQYSPAGLVTALMKQIGDPSQKRLAEDLGRTLTGSTLVALGFMLAREGKATGASPGTAAERAQWDLEGKQANSVRIEDRWVSVSRLAPIGALVSVGAQMYHGASQTESLAGKAATAAYTPLRVTLDQPFVTGVQGTIEALQDPGRAGERFAQRQVASVVPAGVAAVARGTDPLLRDPRGILEALAARIPGASQTVPPRLDPFGQPMTSRGGVLKQLTDVTYSRAASDDPLIQELSRLGVTVGFPSRQRTEGVGRDRERVMRSPDEYRDFLEAVGPETRRALERIVSNPQFARLDDQTKRDLLGFRVSQVRSIATRREAARLRRR